MAQMPDFHVQLLMKVTAFKREIFQNDRDKNGFLWMFLYRFDEITKKLEWFEVWNNVENKLLNVNSLLESKDGNVWTESVGRKRRLLSDLEFLRRSGKGLVCHFLHFSVGWPGLLAFQSA